MNKYGRWRIGALAGAIALLGSLASLEAQALGLGRITVQSALGEPLRAEIDIAEISAEEASSLRAGVGTPEAFRAAGLEYTAAVADLQVSLQKRANGRSYLRLSGGRPVSEPFVDLVLETSWASGRLLRDYTMLFDPPSLRQSGTAGSITPTAPIVSVPPAPPATGISSIPYSPPAAPAMRAEPAAPRATAPAKPAHSGQQITIKAGDTAGKIAAQNKPASISLDQMLVALLRSNPDAFIGGNINRLKSGAVLDIPSGEDAGRITPGEASRTLVAQAKDFNEFRRKLAEGVPATQVGSSSRQAGGKVETKVEDRTSGSSTPDKLTLSKGAVQSKAAAEEKIAKERQAKEAAARVAELSKNINDLNKVGAGTPGAAASATKGTGAPISTVPALPASASAVTSAPNAAASALAVVSAPKTAASGVAIASASKTASATAAPVTPAASVPAATSSAAAAPASAASAPADAASSPASAPATAASQPALAASAVATAPVAKKPAAPPPPPPEPSLLDELIGNPFVLPGFSALILLLAGFGFYRYRQRNNAAQVDSSFLESRLQPDSFFGASGGQRIDTSEGGATGSSLVYSPSQLDAGGDVDPVAEADVYLAYGRDLQAEEILKEAMRTSPPRVAVHAKLMEIYAKRRDAKAFEVVALDAFNLTRGEGSEWAYICEMGRELDPSNSMYQPGGQPQSAASRTAEHEHNASSASFGSSTIPQTRYGHEEPSTSVDFDLDLDFSLGDESTATTALQMAAPAQAPEQTVSMNAIDEPNNFDGLDVDFGNDTVALESTSAQAAAPVNHSSDAALSANGLSFKPEPVTGVSKAEPVTASTDDHGMLEFDMGALSLDLDSPATESPTIAADPASAVQGPLETKFALAEEFRSLGDTDGARSLAEEVVASAEGPLKTKAQAFIKALS